MLLVFILFVHLFLQVVHPYEAESDVELTLLIGDYVVVRKVRFISSSVVIYYFSS